MQAIFLDRDGVINVDTGYAHKPEDIIFINGIFEFCRAGKQAGYKLIVVTNQAGIGRGLYSEEQFHALMQWMMRRFEEEGCALDAYYYSPNHPEHGIGKYKKECELRKPNPGMLLKAAQDFALNLKDCLLVGDSATDIEAAERAGVKAFLFTGDFPNIPPQ